MQKDKKDRAEGYQLIWLPWHFPKIATLPNTEPTACQARDIKMHQLSRGRGRVESIFLEINRWRCSRLLNLTVILHSPTFFSWSVFVFVFPMYMSLYLSFLSLLWLPCISQSCDIALHRNYSFSSSSHQNASRMGYQWPYIWNKYWVIYIFWNFLYLTMKFK